MAYGLDVSDIYYTDHDRVDIGVLQTYKIELDLADEKDFEMESPDYVIPVGGFWYILNTEYGGVIDCYGTDSDKGLATYKGRSFRGILASHIVELSDSVSEKLYQGEATDVVNRMISECELSDLFICENPQISDEISSYVYSYLCQHGTTLYDAIMGSLGTIGFSMRIQIEPDKKIHLYPILAQDYSEYMMYSRVGTMAYKFTKDLSQVNHLIVIGTDDNRVRRTLHFFTDESGTLMPYKVREATDAKPSVDADYIKDKSQQVFFGVDEIATVEFMETTAHEEPSLVDKCPADWKITFPTYVTKKTEYNGDGTVNVSYENFAVIEGELKYSTTPLPSKPTNWDTNYGDYYTRSYNQVTGQYEYSAVGSTTVLDYNRLEQIKDEPLDWKAAYGEYYYKFNTGTGIELRAYTSGSKDMYVPLTSDPSDWATNFKSYYYKYVIVDVKKKISDKEYKKLVDKGRKIKRKKVKGKYVYTEEKLIIDTGYVKDQKFAAVESTSKKKDVAPKFVAKKYYRRESETVIPKFDANNTWRPRANEVAPTWAAGKYFSATKEPDKAPPFIEGNTYEYVRDNYHDIAEHAEDYFAKETSTLSQEISFDDVEVSIGDTVGGRDEYTGEIFVQPVTNLLITIDNGLVSVDTIVGGF